LRFVSRRWFASNRSQEMDAGKRSRSSTRHSSGRRINFSCSVDRASSSASQSAGARNGRPRRSWVTQQVLQGGRAVKRVEDPPDHGRGLLLRVDPPLPAGGAEVANRRAAEPLAPARPVQRVVIHPLLQDAEFRLVRDPVQTEQQAVRAVGRGVDPLGVGQPNPVAAAPLPQWVPRPCNCGPGAHLQLEDQPDAVERDRGQGSRETGSPLDGLTALNSHSTPL
jgi:hypothetical protein